MWSWSIHTLVFLECDFNACSRSTHVVFYNLVFDVLKSELNQFVCFESGTCFMVFFLIVSVNLEWIRFGGIQSRSFSPFAACDLSALLLLNSLRFIILLLLYNADDWGRWKWNACFAVWVRIKFGPLPMCFCVLVDSATTMPTVHRRYYSFFWISVPNLILRGIGRSVDLLLSDMK